MAGGGMVRGEPLQQLGQGAASSTGPGAPGLGSMHIAHVLSEVPPLFVTTNLGDCVVLHSDRVLR